MLSNRNEIKSWLDEMNIVCYDINNDLTVDVSGDVFIGHKQLIEIPIQFNKVSRNFYCAYNNLTSLLGSPHIIGGYLSCSNNNLKTLKYCTNNIIGDFVCHNNPLEDINDLDSKLLIESFKQNRNWTQEIDQYVLDRYLEHWIEKDSNVLNILKDKVSDKCLRKLKYKNIIYV